MSRIICFEIFHEVESEIIRFWSIQCIIKTVRLGFLVPRWRCESCKVLDWDSLKRCNCRAWVTEEENFGEFSWKFQIIKKVLKVFHYDSLSLSHFKICVAPALNKKSPMACDVDKQRFWLFGLFKLYFGNVTWNKFWSHDVDNSFHVEVSRIKVNFDVMIDVGVVVVNERNRAVNWIFIAASCVLGDEKKDISIGETIIFEFVVDF